MQAMFAFEKMVNNKREEEGKIVVCINCKKEGHTIHTCYKLFPQIRSVEGGEKQDQKRNFKRDSFKGKKNPKAMHFNTWDEDEKKDGESEIGPSNDGHSSFCFMAQVNLGDTDKEEEKDFEAIIAKNELTDPIIIEYLRKLHLAKKKVGEPIKVTTQEEVTKEKEKDEKNSSSTKEVQGENKVETRSSPPPKEAKVCLNPILNEDEPIHVSYYASISDSDDNYDDIEDASIFTIERMLKFELARANKFLNETNQALLRSEGTIEGLTKNTLELESKVNEYEIKKIIFEKEHKDFIQQISNLKIDKQLLDLENQTLKSTSASSSGTRLDSTNLYKGQQSHDKTGLGYKKISPSLQSSKTLKVQKKKENKLKLKRACMEKLKILEIHHIMLLDTTRLGLKIFTIGHQPVGGMRLNVSM
jgi:hypothetical protein